MIRRMLPHNVHNGHLRSSCVVKVGESIREAWPEMKQGTRRLIGHTRITVRGARNNPFKQAKHASHFRRSVQCGDHVHLGRAGIAETGIDAALQQAVHKAFCAVHGLILSGSRNLRDLRAVWQPSRPQHGAVRP